MNKVLDKLFGLSDRIKGDKVVWFVFFCLVLYSFVAIFSSTSLKVAGADESRIALFWRPFNVDQAGIGVGLLSYYLPVGFIRWVSQFGFLASFAMLAMLLKSHNLREINIGIPLQPYEFTKVFMVLYLAWATQAFREKKLFILNWLARTFKRLSWLATETAQCWIMLFIPIGLVTVCIMHGGFSSSMMTLAASLFTICFGKTPWRQVIRFALLIIGLILLTYGAWKVTHWSVLGERWETVEARIIRKFSHNKAEISLNKYEMQKILDENRQQEGAKIAVKEGGFLGKGVGKSTQRYAVADMYGDYMFCFILEEYGMLLGGIPLLLLYTSLLARGATIVRGCKQDYSRTVVAGLAILISGQAFLHMAVNVDIGPLTGQTLPLVSYGKSAFLSFCIAFGVILCISRTVERQTTVEPIDYEENTSNN